MKNTDKNLIRYITAGDDNELEMEIKEVLGRNHGKYEKYLDPPIQPQLVFVNEAQLLLMYTEDEDCLVICLDYCDTTLAEPYTWEK